MSTSGRANRLARESSPYLLLHAGNPVDWYPWGEEAFETARREDKPIFLSVGYSTCYWCHVMERQSFSNEAIAAELNAGFVSIKLDREERPDLDEIYMAATQLLTKSGGWPNSVFLTPDLVPFFAGTYFPPEDAHGRPGFPRVLAAIREAWVERRETVLEQAKAVGVAMREQLATPAPATRVDAAAIVAGARSVLSRRFDREWGGFGQAPKFPSPSNLFLLLDLARGGEERAREMLVPTLDFMARGGIHDQLAGGFHRYSTDAEWLVPHFEKMLYDNAALAELYAESDALVPGYGFARVARRTLDFVLAEMTGAEGGFFSAIDAETDGHEGAYYTWTKPDLASILDAEQHALLAPVYGFDGPPNFEGARYVLHLPLPLAERARERQVSEDELHERLEPGQRALLAARAARARPLTDDKILADWNGLAIGAMARAGALLHEPRYLRAAERAAGFVLSRLRDGEGRLLHAWRSGIARVPALLDDYAFMVHGLIALHETTREPRWLSEALRLQAEQDERLWDAEAGGYFSAGEDPRLLIRAKPAHDGALASGNGASALNSLALGRLTGDRAHERRTAALLRAFGKGMSEMPFAHVTLVQALRRHGNVQPASDTPRAGAPKGSALAAEAVGVVEAAGSFSRVALEGGWHRFTVELHVRGGWHLGANPARPAFLVPTEIREGERGEIRDVRYPEASTLRSELAPEPLDVYEGSLRIEGAVRGETPSVLLVYQACDETRCLPPVTREIRLG
jgi:uncharacterized protein